MALKPPVEVPQGAIRLNTDSQKLEFFAQEQWWQMMTGHDPSRGRGIIGGGSVPGNTNVIDYISIASAANAVDFGDLTVAGQHCACASRTRGVFAMGSNVNTIDYVTIASLGNAQDFGDRTIAKNGPGALSNNIRGVFMGGG